MKIQNIYIGGWFQRTMLQLSEVYEFLRSQESDLDLNKAKLARLYATLEIENLEYCVSGEEYIRFVSKNGIIVKIFEDGLITLNCPEVSESTLNATIDRVQDYYEKSLSPALNYLFSLGAPVPKELAGIKNVYPYFVVFDDAKPSEISDLLQKIEPQKYYEFKNSKYNVIRGDKYYFVNNKSKTPGEIERYIEEQIFIREFKAQLHRYLNLHRIIWEKIDAVKAHTKIRGSDIIKFSTKLEGYAKTITLIDGRIKQMSTYIPTREKIAKNDKELSEFLEFSGYSYETLRDTLSYIQYLWDMTRTYVESAQRQFESLKTDMTNRSVDALTVVSSISAGACIMGLFQSMTIDITSDGIISLVALAVVAWGAPKLLGFFSSRRKYEVSDIDIDKNIK